MKNSGKKVGQIATATYSRVKQTANNGGLARDLHFAIAAIALSL